MHITGPLEPCVNREIALVGTLLRGAEMALSGITTVADMMCIAPGPEPVTPGVVEGLERFGLRGDVSYGAADDPNPRPLPQVVAEHEALAAAAARSRRSRFRGWGWRPCRRRRTSSSPRRRARWPRTAASTCISTRCARRSRSRG